MNLADLIDAPVTAVPSRTALIRNGGEISYARVGAAVEAAAASLAANGVRPGDRVALADSCGLLAVATVLGAARIGAAAAPMSPAFTASEMRELAHTAGCSSVGVCGEDARSALTAALGREPLGEPAVLGAPTVRPRHSGGNDDAALVLFTGGTTGAAKPIVMSHATLANRVRSFAQPVDPESDPTVALMCVPFHHVAGLVGTLVGMAGGGTSVVQTRFDAGEWLRLAERHRVSRAFLVPTMLHRILEHPDLRSRDLSALAMITYGAAPAGRDLLERAVERLSWVAFVNVFGQTETLGAVTALGPDEHRAGRIGSLGRPLPGVETRVVDPATEADVPVGVTGELWARAAHTATPGWVRTGDLVWQDPDGYFYAAGRLSDLINRGGEKIAPAEVEAVLRRHPAVEDAAVFGFADAEMGERVAAVVVARERVDPAALVSWCRARMAAFKLPERIVFVDALPMTELGKVSRPGLRRLLG